ncbi:hypothetical protein [Sphingomonas sp. BK235]|uniref:hypothetical protein n=1 Tax=Sphingomonas sp. BK235 TaxID=2512131 RepID=UPI00104BDA77|nr:hypothetical protein [Sphingomonas sp. BK235]TCP36025.1 hypothetical protein EV292_102615 [Sphingomonas sp. BK235]
MAGRGVLAGLIALLTLLLLVPAAVNRGVIQFPDTTTYVRGFDAAVVAATGHGSSWSEDARRALAEARAAAPRAPATAEEAGTGEAGASQTGASEAGASEAAAPARRTGAFTVVLSGRSIYYGALLYVAHWLGSLWWVALAQAALTATAILLAARRLIGAEAPAERLWPVLAIALVTSVGMQVALLMPDIFAPLAILATAQIALFWPRLGTGERLFWPLLLAAAALFHSGNILVIGLLAAGLVAWRVVGRARLTLLPILLALLTGVAGEAAFGAAVRAATGAGPVRPPFVAARLIADGPGRRYLAHACAEGSTLTLCRYRTRIPDDSDAFLWASTPGSFMAMPAEDRRRVAAEERGFALAVLADAPLAVIGTSLRNIGGQLLRWQVDDIADARRGGVNRAKLPPEVRAAYDRTRAAHGDFPSGYYDALALPVTLLAAAVLLALALPRRAGMPAARRGYVAVVVAGILLNAAVCGAFSKPHDRYQSRVIWLVPLLATAALIGARRRAPVRGAAPANV